MKYDFLASLLGQWASESNGTMSIVFRITLAFVFAALVGWERSTKRHSAGLRTFMLVGLGAVSAAICDCQTMAMGMASFAVLSAATIIALATICCNTILFSSKNQLKGLTTSACLWVTGLVSLCIGLGYYYVAATGFIAQMLCTACFPAIEKRLKANSPHFEIHLELKSRNLLRDFMQTVREFGLKIDDIEFNPAYANSGLGVYTVMLTVVAPELRKRTHAQLVQALAALDCVHFIEEI